MDRPPLPNGSGPPAPHSAYVPPYARPTRLLLALLPPLLAAALYGGTGPLLAEHPWLLFFPAVFLSAWIGGFVGSALATALAVMLVQLPFVPPSPAVAAEQSEPFTAGVVLVISGLLFGVFQELLRQANFVARTALAAVQLSEASLRSSRERLRQLFEHSPDGVFVVDPGGVYVDVNAAGCAMLGYRREELLGKRIRDLLPAGQHRQLQESTARLNAGATETGEWLLRRRDGDWLPVEVTARALPDGSLQGIVRDISERLRMLRELREHDDKLRQAAIVFDSTDEAIVVADADGRIVRVNSAYTAITGFSADEVLGQDVHLRRSDSHDAAFYQRIVEALERSGQWRGEIWQRRKSGELYPAWQNVSVVRDEQGQVTHYVAVFSDISQVKQSEQRMAHLAHHDALTGVPNRLLFSARLEQAIERARRHSQRVALLFLDLDRFKMINDTLGHAAGDRLLQTVAERLREHVRAEDTVARLGGDEFTVILEEFSGPEAGKQLAGKLIEAVAEPVVIDGHEVRTSTSIGMALYPEDADQPEDLLRAADAAMYRAKARGRNTFECYHCGTAPADLVARAAERSAGRRLH